MKNKTLCVACVQEQADSDPVISLDRTIAAIRRAAGKGAKLILLQELHNGYYFCQTEDSDNFKFAETIPGPTSDVLGRLAKELQIVIVASLFERRAAGLYHNTAVVLEKTGEIAGIYRKMHIPDDPGFYEKYYFTPGDLGFTPITTSVGKLGVLVCWDQWYPEAARLMALAGAEILLYPTAIGWVPTDPDQRLRQQQCEAWQIMQRAHSVANGLPVMVCNRVGLEKIVGANNDGIEFWGNSFITGAQGQILASAPTHEPTILTTTIDFAETEIVRQGWPFLRDRRIDTYHGLLQRYLS